MNGDTSMRGMQDISNFLKSAPGDEQVKRYIYNDAYAADPGTRGQILNVLRINNQNDFLSAVQKLNIPLKAQRSLGDLKAQQFTGKKSEMAEPAGRQTRTDIRIPLGTGYWGTIPA